MFKTIKSEEMQEALVKMKRKNLGAFFSINGSDFLSCSCGKCAKIKIKDIATYTEDRAGRRFTLYTCPSCGNDAIIPWADVEDYNIPILFEHNVLRDDDLFWVISLDTTWIHFDVNDPDGNCAVSTTYDDNSVIVYDRIKQFLFVSERYSWHLPLSQNQEWWSWCTELEYHDEKCWDRDGNLIAGVYDADYLTEDSSYSMDYPLDAHFSEISHMADILRLIAGVAKVNLIDLDIGDDGFESLLSSIIYRADFPWLDSFLEDYDACGRTKNFSQFGPDANHPIRSWFNLQKNGYGMSAESFLSASGVPSNVLADISCWSTYHDVKSAMKALSETDLDETVINWLKEDVPYAHWNNMMQLANDTGTELPICIRHMHRAKENGYDAATVLSCYLDMLKKGFGSEINLNGAFTRKTYRMCELLLDGTLTLEQYKAILQRPTMDTFLKTVGIA